MLDIIKRMFRNFSEWLRINTLPDISNYHSTEYNKDLDEIVRYLAENAGGEYLYFYSPFDLDLLSIYKSADFYNHRTRITVLANKAAHMQVKYILPKGIVYRVPNELHHDIPAIVVGFCDHGRIPKWYVGNRPHVITSNSVTGMRIIPKNHQEILRDYGALYSEVHEKVLDDFAATQMNQARHLAKKLYRHYGDC